jgi:hypothetical protein
VEARRGATRRGNGGISFARHFGLANSPETGDYVTMIRRHIEESVRRAMTDTPVVLLNGARQTGKTTLWVAKTPSQWD